MIRHAIPALLLGLAILPTGWFVAADLITSDPEIGRVEVGEVDPERTLALADAADRRVAEVSRPVAIMAKARLFDEDPVPDSAASVGGHGGLRGALEDLDGVGRAAGLVRDLVDAEGRGKPGAVDRIEAVKDRAHIGPSFPGRGEFFGLLERRIELRSKGDRTD